MKTLVKYIQMLSVTIFLVGIVGCSGTPERLDTAARLVNERPDSAYAILCDIDYNDLDADSLKAKYILTRALTNRRVGRSYITDTLLNKAVEYYISAGDTANWVLASNMLAASDFIMPTVMPTGCSGTPIFPTKL